MALFTDERAVYGAFGKLFSDVVADEKSVGVLVRTNTILQLQLREPRSTVTVAVRQGQEPLIYFGPTTRRPEVFLQMDAETAHGWFLGEINPTVAFGDNRIKGRGPSGQILAVLAWAKVLVPTYKAIIEAHDGELPPPLAPPEPEAAVEAAPAAEGAAEGEAPAVEPAADGEAPAEAEASPAAGTGEGDSTVEEAAPAEEAAAEAESAPDPEPAAEAEAPGAEEPAPDAEPAAAEEPAAPAAEEAPAVDPAPEDEAPADA